MAKFFRGILSGCIVLLALACGAFAALLLHAPVFAGGKGYELYLSPSSSALTVQSEVPARDKLFLPVQGESVRYDGDKRDELLTRFRAEVLFTEEAAGVVNYYCHSPVLGESVLLNGRAINLHIAVSKEQTAAGTPLIFGGF